MAEKNYPVEVFYSIFFTPPRRADVRLRGTDLCGCAVSLQNRTRRHDAPYAAEQTAAPTCVSGLCRSSPVNSPPAGGIGVRVLPASAGLISNGDACARRRGLRCFATTFYAAHQKSSLIRFVAPPFQNANSSLVCILVFFLVATLVAM